MHFTYCPHCGEKLVQKEIGDEGKMPYCKNCEIPLWDSFTTCVICAVVNEQKEIALLRQNYVSADSYVCVAGVMKMGESAEKTAAREVAEEIGQKAERKQRKIWYCPVKWIRLSGFRWKKREKSYGRAVLPGSW